MAPAGDDKTGNETLLERWRQLPPIDAEKLRADLEAALPGDSAKTDRLVVVEVLFPGPTE